MSIYIYICTKFLEPKGARPLLPKSDLGLFETAHICAGRPLWKQKNRGQLKLIDMDLDQFE